MISLETLAKALLPSASTPPSPTPTDPLLPVALLANMMANGASHRDTAEDTRRCGSNNQTLV